MDSLDEIEQQTASAVREIVEVSHIKKGQIFVIGCSTSEVGGQRIGSHSSMDIAGAIYRGAMSVLKPAGIWLAAVVERPVCDQYDLEQVNAIPQPDHAGGAFGTACWQHFDDPILVEDLKAKAAAGLDIGQTLIGMHIHPVVVPVRISLSHIGDAVITCARRRPKYVGGQRAIYDRDLM